MKLKKKFLAMMLSTAMLVTAMAPTVAMAADGDESSTTSSGVELSKTVTLENDGTYTINLEAYATGEVTTTTTTKTEGVPCDIVLVLDQSGSMKDSIGSATVYKAQNSTSYTNNNYSNNRYYLDEDGKYYQVFKTSDKVDNGCNDSTTYYFMYYEKNGTKYYLDGRNVTTQKPQGVTGTRDTIWTGVLYSQTTESVTKQTALKTAVTQFTDQVYANAKENNVDHKVAIVGFASDGNIVSKDYTNTELLSTGTVVAASNTTDTLGISVANYRDALVSANDGGSKNTRLTNAINEIAASGGTAADSGLKLAKNVLDNRTVKTYTKEDGATANRKTIVVFFTDGFPGRNTVNNDAYFSNDSSYLNIQTADRAITVADSIKENGTVIYSVGVIKGADPTANYNFSVTNSSSRYSTGAQAANAFLHFVSSDFTAAVSMTKPDRKNVVNNGFYLAADNADALTSVFETITSSIDSSSSSSSCTLDQNSVLRDVIADEFDGTNAYIDSVKTAAYKGNDQWDTPITLAGAVKNKNGANFDVSGFDYKSNYVVDEEGTVKASGKKLMVTIKGVLPKDAAVTGEAIATNKATSGIYATASADTPAAVFEQPETILTKKAFVVDYAKNAALPAAKLDQNTVSGIAAAFKTISAADNAVTGTYGNTALANGALSYQPKTMNWDGYDSFYVFGSTTDAAIKAVDANANGNLWSKVSVVPANNVYYEDDFVVNAKTGVTAGIVYTGSWNAVGTSSNTETASEAVQGWSEVLEGTTGDTDGTNHNVTVSATTTATAKFTFTGTGVEILGRTTPETGTIMVTVKGDGVNKGKVIDTVSRSGEYYQVPTASFTGLDYGTYEVTVYVTGGAKAESRFTYYIDGIRVFNPVEEDKTVQAAYGAEELGAQFLSVHDLLLTQGAGDVKTVFIDEDENGASANIEYTSTVVFNKYAPKNEVYLAKGQAIALQVMPGAAYNYFVSVKSLQAGSGTVSYTNGSDKSEKTVGTADQFIKVVPSAAGIAEIQNTGDTIIAINTLKVTTNAGGDSSAATQSLLVPDTAAVLAYAEEFGTLSIVDDTPVVPEQKPVDVVITEPEAGVTRLPGISTDLFKDLFSSIKKVFTR